MMKATKIFLFFLLLTGCSWRSATDLSYRNLQQLPAEKPSLSERFLLVCVSAPHLNYSSETALFTSLAKHPRNASKDGSVGHAWIVLVGDEVVEVGHSGELGEQVPKYFDGVMDLADQQDPDPIRYLWQTLPDGFRQKGAGGHFPNLVVRFPLSEGEYEAIQELIERYDYANYSLRDHQCTTLVVQAAAIVGIDLSAKVQVPIAPYVHFSSGRLQLWADERYSEISIATPDLLERALREGVLRGEGEVATGWYRRHVQRGRFSSSLSNASRVPKRLWRWMQQEVGR